MNSTASSVSGTSHEVAILWFRRDLRLTDNPALIRAIEAAKYIVPVYIHAPEEDAPWQPGAASRWWLHHSLQQLDDSLKQRRSKLVIRNGNSLSVLQQLITETGATLITWNRLYDPTCIARDTLIKKTLHESGVEVISNNSALLFEPWTIQTKQRTPFKVFTPFWRSCQMQLSQQPAPLPAPSDIPLPSIDIKSTAINALELLPHVHWYEGLQQRWMPGEQPALHQLQRFIENRIDQYSSQRDQPAISGTSSLSPHLHFGELGPRQIISAINASELHGVALQNAGVFIKELGWREFACHLLYHFPHTAEQSLDTRFERFSWQKNEVLLQAWRKGQTGIPLVDAGMRELWHTGWMHNRVRMIVASFLTKNLRMHWLQGARWFWNTLVDADLASNTLGWQWTAGCGADAAPYFRVFNPVLQAERFDTDAMYIRKWIPELTKLPNHWIACPWQAPETELMKADIKLGQDYPRPIVDLSQSREAALAAYAELKTSYP